MTNKNKISVKILGREHYLISTDQIEYVEKVAKIVDDRMSAILRSNSSLSHTKIGVLTSLNLADDLTKARKKIEELKVHQKAPKIEISETKQQVLAMTKQITEAESLYTNILQELDAVSIKRVEQEKTISSLTEKLEEMCKNIVGGDESLKQAIDHIAFLEKKLLLRESEISEYIKVFDEIEKENLEESESFEEEFLEPEDYGEKEEDIIFEGEIEDY